MVPNDDDDDDDEKEDVKEDVVVVVVVVVVEVVVIGSVVTAAVEVSVVIAALVVVIEAVVTTAVEVSVVGTSVGTSAKVPKITTADHPPEKNLRGRQLLPYLFRKLKVITSPLPPRRPNPPADTPSLCKAERRPQQLAAARIQKAPYLVSKKKRRREVYLRTKST